MKPKINAERRRELDNMLRGHVERLADAAFRLGLSFSEVTKAVEEAIVNWTPPTKPPKRTK